MQIRGQFSDFFFDTALPALNAKIWQSFKAKTPLYNKVLNAESTTRSIEQFTTMAGVGLPTEIRETEDINVDNFVPGFPKNFVPLKYGLGIACSQELIEDDKAGIVSRRGVALSNSIYQSREIQGASVINNAFDGTNFPGGDTKALCAIDHTLLKAAGTQSNMMAVAADLDVASLEIALSDWELIKTHEGFLQLLPSPRVLVATQNRWNVAEILKSQYRSDTANHTINAFQYSETGQTIDYLCWAYLTDPDAWFLIAPPNETELLWLDRKAPYTDSDYYQKNETGFVYMRYRATYGFYGWRGVYGTPGA